MGTALWTHCRASKCGKLFLLVYWRYRQHSPPRTYSNEWFSWQLIGCVLKSCLYWCCRGSRKVVIHYAEQVRQSEHGPRYIDRATRDGFGAELTRLFGLNASWSAPLATSGAGCRLTGVDLAGVQLSPDRVAFLLDAVARFGILCIAGQDLERFTLYDFERLANHWGAPYPHPSNFTRDGVLGSEHGPTDGEVQWVPFVDRRAAGVTGFPGRACVPTTRVSCGAHRQQCVLRAW